MTQAKKSSLTRLAPKAPAPARQSVSLFETVYSKPGSIDRVKGIIRHVKIIGHESKNGRQYPQATLEAAKPLYEGRMVNKNHHRKKTEDLDVDNRFGWFEAVLAEPDGLFGDFHLLDPTDPLARKLFTAAEHKPDAFGFSHHALGAGRQESGVFVVESIQSVESVDIVAEPATTKGLFESEQTTMTTVKAVLESFKAHASFDVAKRTRLRELLEAMPMDQQKPDAPLAGMADAPMEEPAPEASPDDGVGAAFKQMVCSVFDDDTLDAKGKIKKIGEILKAQEKLMAPVDAPAGDDAANAEAADQAEDKADAAGKGKGKGDMPPDEKKVTESLARTLQAELGVRDLIEEAGLKFAKPEARKAFIKSLIPLTESERKAMIDERKQLTEASPFQAQQPRSGAPGRQLTESTQKFPTSYSEAKGLLTLN